jgi:hypothetical protein
MVGAVIMDRMNTIMGITTMTAIGIVDITTAINALCSGGL